MLSEQWKKPSKSNPSGNCVEVKFDKASRSNGNGGNNCIEVGFSKAKRSYQTSNCVEVGFASASKSGAAGHCVEVGFAKAQASVATSDCVEIAFASATKSGPAGHCVEVAVNGDQFKGCGCDDVVTTDGQRIEGASGFVLVRDSKDKTGDGLVLKFTPEQWVEFTGEVVRHGMGWPHKMANPTQEFGIGIAFVVNDPERNPGKRLYYTEAEWDAFIDGLFKGEFKLPEGVGK